jgi:hypothetical protein
MEPDNAAITNGNMLSWHIVCALRSDPKHYERYLAAMFECLDPALGSAHSGRERRAGGAARSPRGWRVWRVAEYPLGPLRAVHLAAVLEVLLPLRWRDPADREHCARRAPAGHPGPGPRGRPRPGQEAGSGLQLQARRDRGSPPRSRRARLRRDPDDRPDASFGKGKAMERPVLRIDLPEVLGQRGAYGPIYVRRWPVPITDSARIVTYVVRVNGWAIHRRADPVGLRPACGPLRRRSSRSQ